MKLPNSSDQYTQDESGQWWCSAARKNRHGDYAYVGKWRVYPKTCKQCGEEFVTEDYKTAVMCSRACTHASQKGKRRNQESPRDCPICGKEYQRVVRRPWRRTCGDPKCVRALADQHLGYEWGSLTGPDSPAWKGGKRLQTKAGYIMVYAGPGLPSRLEHRVVMEEMLGRPLQRFEEVHHRNGVRSDNRPENLELWVKRQPGGSPAKDLVEYARWVLETYGPVEDKL
jgi:hypothetical protein